ncbi:hypothetical protein KK137_04725 [Croceibacterium sp. LX-88]|uniref:Uncharacterized protein n=1 Tax=Croceibacterium selenioxidans TaxID=2838833 RepID=A0ABS5W1K3_9SPHN|nr:hypothetical protein [Croceibacterium selenioxidans]MBT2133631.1 hypothetical protein [Croceibacterium selenioxidans]
MSQFTHPNAASHNWENEGGSVGPESYAGSLGVVRVLTETFKVGGYTYTNLADAVAQARRIQAPRIGR